MALDMAKYRQDFLEEAAEHLAEMSRALLQLEKDPRRAEAILLANPVVVDPPSTPYLRYGDWFAAGCLVLAVAAVLPTARRVKT